MQWGMINDEYKSLQGNFNLVLEIIMHMEKDKRLKTNVLNSVNTTIMFSTYLDLFCSFFSQHKNELIDRSFFSHI